MNENKTIEKDLQYGENKFLFTHKGETYEYILHYNTGTASTQPGDGVTVLEEYEPLVAYLTADSRKKVLKNLDKELIRLCAAILGCPYDALRQRHKRRKMQQTIVAFAAAFLVSLSFIGMLVNRNLEIEAQKPSDRSEKSRTGI